MNEGGFLRRMYARLWKPLCTFFLHCNDMDLYHGHSERLSHHLHALHRQWIQKHLFSCNIEANIGRLYVIKRKRATENAEMFQRWSTGTEKNWTVLRGDLLGVADYCFHSAFMQDCPRSTTYAIYSHTLFIHTASWLLASKITIALKLFFVAVFLCILCFFIGQQTGARMNSWRGKQIELVIYCHGTNNMYYKSLLWGIQFSSLQFIHFILQLHYI